MTLSFDLFAARVHAIYRLPLNRAMNSPWNVGRLAQVFAVSFCVSVGSVPATVTPDSPPGQRAVELGPPIDLADMAVTKQAGSMKLGAANVSTNSLTFQVDEKSCFIYATPEGYDYLAVGELLPEAQPGQPLLPAKTFKVELDKEAEVLGLEVIEGTFREIKAELNLLPAFQADGPNVWQIIADDKVYRASVLFPGRLVSMDHGADNQRQYVFARLFPVQYLPAKKRAMLLTQATLRLYYRSKGPPGAAVPDAGAKRVQGDRAPGLATEAQCIVLCPAKLQPAAEKLSRFHAGQEGITSAVVTTEAIGQAYAPAEDPPHEGYQNSQLDGRDQIRNYDYVLAKKIIAYLRDQQAHPRLVYVTILGDGLLVPPSFYFHSRLYETLNYPWSKEYRTHPKWVPTDLFYASPDYDWVPNFRMGRLSVNDPAEAAKVVDKVIRWHENADWYWFRNVQLGGMGSLAALRAEREGLFEGMKVKKFLFGDDRTARVFIEPALTSRDTGIFWCVLHGGVTHQAWPDSLLRADDLLRYSPHDKVPIVISITCSAGAFDLDLLRWSSERAAHSFGEGVLNSPAGGIAYFGSSRNSRGGNSCFLREGQTAIIRQWYFQELLYDILQSRRQGADTLGQLYADALFAFVSNNDMAGNPRNVLTAFQYVHLGDPALKIPVRP
jgi:hypothetical protein